MNNCPRDLDLGKYHDKLLGGFMRTWECGSADVKGIFFLILRIRNIFFLIEGFRRRVGERRETKKLM